jgi:hypothetical protein
MRSHEISHPHVVELSIDPADCGRLERDVADARELRLLNIDDSAPDVWKVRIGCASRRVQAMMEDRWA